MLVGLTQRLNLWRKLTGLKDFGLSSSHYSIASDTWKYIHRLIATSINCQPGTVDVVFVEDLNIMWAIDQGEPTNWFDVFSKRFIRMQGQYTSIRFVGCTQLITLIAEIYCFRFYCHPDEYREYDLACLQKLRILARKLKVPDLSDKDKDSMWEDDHSEASNQAKRRRKVNKRVGKEKSLWKQTHGS